MKFVQVEFDERDEKTEYVELIEKVVETCFKEEKLEKTNLYLNVILTNPEKIKNINKEYRNVDKATDVLSFPMFEKNEIESIINIGENNPIKEDVLGDIIISIPKVIEQAAEYGHSVERELAYMVVHGFYHIMGYDHIKEEDKKIMRPKEENILSKLKLTREEEE